MGCLRRVQLSLAFLLIASAAAVATAAQQECRQECQCQRLGGTFRRLQAPMLPNCRIDYYHNGRQRYVQVYLPQSYDGNRRFPLWVQVHGVFWNTMGGIGQKVGPINATDIVPTWDRIVSQFGDRAIIAYPQSLGNPGTGQPSDGLGAKYRQFWSTPFWRCSVNICAEEVDDIGFLNLVLNDLQRRLQVEQGQVLLTGTSAGGMLIEALLCESNQAVSNVAAVVDALGGIGRDYARGGACANAVGHVPFLKLHGMKDASLTYDREAVVDGVPFLSTVDLVRFRAEKAGCSGGGGDEGGHSDDGTKRCSNLCANKPGKPDVKLCGIIAASHETQTPWPGYVWQQAWAFFNEQLGKRGMSIG